MRPAFNPWLPEGEGEGGVSNRTVRAAGPIRRVPIQLLGFAAAVRPAFNPSPVEGEGGARDGLPFLLAKMGPDAGG